MIKKILKYLGLWEVKWKPSPHANALPIIPDSYLIPRCRVEALGEDRSVDDYVTNPDRSTLRLTTCYPVEAYL